MACVEVVEQFGLEAAYVAGPVTLLGEYARVKADIVGGSDESADAWSLEAGYWLTGENTGYDKTKGSWSRAMPKHNFGDGEGQGAWRVSLRYDTIDSDAIGDADQWTAGVSWLLNPNTGVHLNVVHFDPGSGFGGLDALDIIGVRVEIDF